MINLTAQQWLFLLAFTVMLIGLVGTLAPVIPGIALIWVTGLVYAIVERFGAFDPISFIVFTLLGVFGVTAEFLLTQAGAKVTGASRQAMTGGLVGAAAGFVAGLFLGGIGAVPGAFIGALIGVTLFEYRQHRNLKKAGLVAGGWLAGCLASKVVVFLIALTMVVIFVWQAGIRP